MFTGSLSGIVSISFSVFALQVALSPTSIGTGEQRFTQATSVPTQRRPDSTVRATMVFKRLFCDLGEVGVGTGNLCEFRFGNAAAYEWSAKSSLTRPR